MRGTHTGYRLRIACARCVELYRAGADVLSVTELHPATSCGRRCKLCDVSDEEQVLYEVEVIETWTPEELARINQIADEEGE